MEGIAICVGAENANNETSFHTWSRDARPNEPKTGFRFTRQERKPQFLGTFTCSLFCFLEDPGGVQSHVSHDHCMDTRLLFVLTSLFVGQDVHRKGVSFNDQTHYLRYATM